MRPLGRRRVAPVGLLGAIALSLCVAAAGFADTVKAEVELTTKEVGSKETVLGNVVADAIREAAKSDAAFIAAHWFDKVTIPKGNVETSEILKALDYKSDTIVIVKLTGDQILRGLEHSLYLYPQFNGGFLHVSGMTVTFAPDAEKEKRVLSVKIGGETLSASKTYRVAMPAPLANGALVYFKIWKKGDIEKETNKTLEAALLDYLKDHKTLAKGDERLVIKKS